MANSVSSGAGLKTAYAVFKKAVGHSRAYRNFLIHHKISPSAIGKAGDFSRLPPIDKKTYIMRYAWADLLGDRKFPPMVYASSGSSGYPTFWFRGDREEEFGARVHEIIFRDIFDINKNEKTLVVVCFGMGIWIAGNYTLASCRYMARYGRRLTVVTPGIEKEDIKNVLQNLASKYRNLVLAGYPPFLMDVVKECIAQKINIPQRVKLLTAGDKFEEKWREEMADLLHIKNPYRSIVNIYGSADAGIIGYETPPAIFIRQVVSGDRGLRKDLFGDGEATPGLFQYNPRMVYLEVQGGEIVLTADTSIPLVRYNIHDVGRIIEYGEMRKFLEKSGLLRAAEKHGFARWRFPFILKKGRTDVAVTFYAINIYPEHLKAGLDERRIRRSITGNYYVYARPGRRSGEILFMDFEMRPGAIPSRKFKQQVKESVVQNLLTLNSEYRKLYAVIGLKAFPRVRFFAAGRMPQKKFKGLLNLAGKKPRVNLN